MVTAEQDVMKSLCRIEEELFFLCQGLKSAGDEGINDGDGRIDARIATGAASMLSSIAERLNTAING